MAAVTANERIVVDGDEGDRDDETEDVYGSEAAAGRRAAGADDGDGDGEERPSDVLLDSEILQPERLHEYQVRVARCAGGD